MAKERYNGKYLVIWIERYCKNEGKSIKKNQVDWSVFFKAVVTIALPIALQNFLSTTASMVDTIMIGSQGELSVAAVGICSQISSLFFSCYFGFAGGSLLFFSQYWGAGNHKGINKIFGFPELHAGGGAYLRGDGDHKPRFFIGDLYG